MRRFDANSYLYLTKAVDLHDVSRGYPSLESALERITAKVLLVAIRSDDLFPPHQTEEIVRILRGTGAAMYATSCWIPPTGTMRSGRIPQDAAHAARVHGGDFLNRARIGTAAEHALARGPERRPLRASHRLLGAALSLGEPRCLLSFSSSSLRCSAPRAPPGKRPCTGSSPGPCCFCFCFCWAARFRLSPRHCSRG